MTDFLDAGWGVRVSTPALREHHSLVDLLDWDDHQQYVPRRGFIDPAEVTVAFNNGARVYTVTPVGASFRLSADGVVYTLTDTYQVAITDTEGTWYIYFVVIGGQPILTASQVAWDLDAVMPVGIIQWDATNKIAIFDAYERHGLTYPSRVHNWAHYSIGTVYSSGLDLTDFSVTGTGALDTDAQCALTGGLVFDEDIFVGVTPAAVPAADFEQILAVPAQIPVYYKSGAGGAWRRYAANTFPCADAAKVGAGTRLHYNNPAGPWTVAEVPSTNHVACWIVATNDRTNPVKVILGQRQDGTLTQAQNNNLFQSLDLTGLPFQEMRVLYRIIFQTANGYGNTPKARIRNVQDLRADTIRASGQYVPVSHGSLSGLTRDDHPQYLLGGALITRVNLTASQNDWNPASLQTSQVLLIDPDAAWNITGITAPDGTYREDGKILILINVDAALDITLTDEDAASAAANRMALGGADVTLSPGQAAMLIYDLTAQRWRPAAGSGGGGSLVDTVITPALINANQDDYEPAGLQTATAMRLETDASRNITGIRALSVGDRTMKIFNIGAFDLVLKNEDAASVAANRLALGIDLTLAANEGCTLWYDNLSARWRCCGRHI